MNTAEIAKQIEELKAKIADLEASIKEEAEKKNKQFQKWMPEKDNHYWTIVYSTCNLKAREVVWRCKPTDYELLEHNLVFRSQERAQEVASKIDLLLKLEAVKDILCPEYEIKKITTCFERNNTVEYNCDAGKYITATMGNGYYFPTATYFDTVEHARQAADILNDK